MSRLLDKRATFTPGRRPVVNIPQSFQVGLDHPKDRRGPVPGTSPTVVTAPLRGLSNLPFAFHGGDSQSAALLENFWPTPTGVKPRPGIENRVNGIVTPDSYKASQLIPYSNGKRRGFIVFKDGGVYRYKLETATSRITFINTVTDDGFSYADFAGDAGVSVIMVNGKDKMVLYDGSDDVLTGMKVIDHTSTPHIRNEMDSTFSADDLGKYTGIGTDDFSYVFTYKNRVFFIEGDTANAWYLPQLSIGGAVQKLPLSAVFNRFSPLLFGASWSVDAGDNLNDRVVFVTVDGQVAIYGGDPSTDFALEGVYDIGRPLGRFAHFSYGGDIIIGTVKGPVSLKAVVSGTFEDGRGDSIGNPIQRDWDILVRRLPPGDYWRMSVWRTRGYAFLYNNSIDDTHMLYGINLNTLAWFTSRISTGSTSLLRIISAGEIDTNFYLFDSSGGMWEFTGGNDNGEDIECVVVHTPIHHPVNVVPEKAIVHWRGDPVTHNVAAVTRPDQYNKGDVPFEEPFKPGGTQAIWGKAVWGVALFPYNKDTGWPTNPDNDGNPTDLDLTLYANRTNPGANESKNPTIYDASANSRGTVYKGQDGGTTLQTEESDINNILSDEKDSTHVVTYVVQSAVNSPLEVEAEYTLLNVDVMVEAPPEDRA